MTEKVEKLRERGSGGEGVAIKVDPRRIDPLGQEGPFNRAGFIRVAMRDPLRIRSEEASRSMKRHVPEPGAARAGVGLVRDVTPEPALQTIGSPARPGAPRANPRIKAALAARIN